MVYHPSFCDIDRGEFLKFLAVLKLNVDFCTLLIGAKGEVLDMLSNFLRAVFIGGCLFSFQRE
jgi:hypothetical protein